jgi:hypothetical protein
MARRPLKLFLLAGTVSLLAAIPALSQEAALPPGFGEPEPQPKTTPVEETEAPTPEAPQAAETPGTAAPSVRRRSAPVPGLETRPLDAGQEDLEQLPVRPPRLFDVPEEARRTADVVGPLDEANWGLGFNAFGSADGAYLSSLMRRLDAPLPSRWTSMLLRRALLSQVPSPRKVVPVDWVAQRAWLLLRMGEADGARILVQSVEVPEYTPTMIQVAVQAALATSDPAGLCPLVEPGRAISEEPVWALSDAMCAALSGEGARASVVLGQARNRSGVSPIDASLAQKIIGAASDVRRAVRINWEQVSELNSWRFGLATAAGIELPPALVNRTGRHVQAWLARAPMVPFEQRIAAADVAASLGVFSNAAMVDLYSMIGDTFEGGEGPGAAARRLREAYVHGRASERVERMRQLWNEASSPDQRHARRILTAVAAARIAPAEEHQRHAADLIASMLTGGFDREAGRWAQVVEAADDTDDRAWALLAVASPTAAVDVSSGRISAFQGRDESRGALRSRMLLAALAGLGRIDAAGAGELAGDMGLQLGRQDSWTRALDEAARARQPGTVALLAAIGMQTGDWNGVPPEHLYRIVRALTAVGHEYEARMIAAEALSRL